MSEMPQIKKFKECHEYSEPASRHSWHCLICGIRGIFLFVAFHPFEILAMAWRSLGANKLRSGLTISGIMIGIFSVISVMTTISALEASIETGLTFLGSNIF